MSVSVKFSNEQDAYLEQPHIGPSNAVRRSNALTALEGPLTPVGGVISVRRSNALTGVRGVPPRFATDPRIHRLPIPTMEWIPPQINEI